jgi:hypothetical protein
MLIDINLTRWEEIKAELKDRGALSSAGTVRGKLIQFPEPEIESLDIYVGDICVGSEN